MNNKIILYADNRETQIIPYLKTLYNTQPPFKKNITSTELKIDVNSTLQFLIKYEANDNNEENNIIASISKDSLIDILDFYNQAQNVINDIEKSILTFETKQLQQGDYIICNSNNDNNIPIAIIERKTLKDYAASFKDKRHFNKEKLLKFREITGAKIYYIIEGKMNVKLEKKYANIQFKQILASIYNLMINTDIYIINTDSPEDTANKLKFLAESYQANIENGKFLDINSKTANINGGNDIAKIVLNIDDAILKAQPSPTQKDNIDIIKIWSNIKGISDITAATLAQNISINDWINNNNYEKNCKDDKNDYINIINNLKINGRNLNIKVKTLLLNAPTENDMEKLLIKFPQITAKTITIIKSQYSLLEINNIADKELAAIKISPSTKLGIKKAQTIKKFLSYKIINI